MKKTLIALAIAITSPIALAGGYVGGNYSTLDYSEDGLGKDLSIGAVSAVGGYQLNDYVAVEARVGVGVSDDSYLGATLELDNYYGAYLKFGAPIGNFYPYAMVGMTEGEVTASVTGFSLSQSESDVSYAAGIGYYINENINLHLEYARFLDKDAISIEGFTLGINYHF